MAISTNPLLHKLSGQIGKQLVFKQYGGKTVVSNYPDMSRRKLSPKQIRINEIMADAHYEAKRVLLTEELRVAAQVRLNVTRNRLYTALIKEYFKKVLPATETTASDKGK
jgi:flagellar motor switch protein FliM